MRNVKVFMILALLFAVGCVHAQKVWDGSYAVGFESGMGTKESPFEIQTPEQFAFFINAINKGETFYGKEIVMTRDISLNNIALGAWDNTTFSGKFDGLGHYIYDMYCHNSYGYTAHMFYNLEGTICNLACQGKFYSSWISSFVENVKPLGIIYHCEFEINMNVACDDGLAIIATTNNGSIVDCKTSGVITCSPAHSTYRDDYDAGEYYSSGIYENTGTHIQRKQTTELNNWLSLHSDITSSSFEYTEPTCTVQFTDPEGVVVASDIVVRNGLTFGGINYPTTGYDCTINGYRWRGKTLDNNAFIDREYVNVYPIYKRTIKQQPTSDYPTVIVDDRAHAQYNWYKLYPGTKLYDDWSYAGDYYPTSKTYNINVEAGDSLTFDYDVNGRLYSDYLIVTLDGSQLINTSSACRSYKYYFAESGSHSLVVSYNRASGYTGNYAEASLKNIRVSQNIDNLVEKNANCTLNINNKSIENGASYYCIVSYSNSSTKLRSSSFVVLKDNEKPDTDISSLANTIYLDNCEAFCGKTIELPVKMKNDIVATGFQFDIILPEGITVLQDEDGFYDITLSTERTTAAKTNTFDSSLMSDGSIRVLAASTRNYAFSGNDGEVCIIKLKVSEDLPAGEYPIVLKNIELTNAQGQTWNVERLKRTITVKDYQLGDANGDGRVSVGDFSAVANHILGTTPEDFNLGAADANQDNNISVGDLSTIATMILSNENSGASKVRAKAAEELVDLNNYIYANPVVISEDGDATIVFNMKNEIAATGFQFNFKLPEGFDVTEDEDGFLDVFLSQTRTTSRKTNTFDCVKWDDGSYRVLAASTKNYEFSGNDGEVVTVHIQRNAEVESGDYELLLTDIELTNASGQTFRTSKATYTIVVPASANEIALMDGEEYSNNTTTAYDALTYTRTFANTEWQALYVPFAMNYDDWAEEFDVARISGMHLYDYDEDGEVDETSLEILRVKKGALLPNTPYLIRAKETGEKTVTLSDAVLYATDATSYDVSTWDYRFTFTGTYATIPGTTMAADGYYALGGGTLHQAEDATGDLKPFRWYMAVTDRRSAAPAPSKVALHLVGEEDLTTGLVTPLQPQDAPQDAPCYDLSGRRVIVPAKGVFIKNGKKTIVR